MHLKLKLRSRVPETCLQEEQSVIEVPNMQDNIPAVLSVMKVHL